MGEKWVEKHKQKSGTCNDASPSVTIEGPREGKEGKKKGTREGQEEIPPEGLRLGQWSRQIGLSPQGTPMAPLFSIGRERSESSEEHHTLWTSWYYCNIQLQEHQPYQPQKCKKYVSWLAGTGDTLLTSCCRIYCPTWSHSCNISPRSFALLKCVLQK